MKANAKLRQGWVEEIQVLRWIDNCIAEQSAQLYHKFDNTRGSDYARDGSMELNVAKTMEE